MKVKERIAKIDKELEKIEWERFELKYPNVFNLIKRMEKFIEDIDSLYEMYSFNKEKE
jgi:hypothetical protein